jgi:WD40 repeat protein
MSQPPNSHEPPVDEPDEPVDPLDPLQQHLTAWDEKLRQHLAGSSEEVQSTGDPALDSLRRCIEMLHRAWPTLDEGTEASLLDDAVEVATNPDRAPAELPKQLGRFQIEHILGTGGFGVVYLAHDPRLNRPVALKVPRLLSLADPRLRERFRQEARAAASLDHPHIIPIHETGLEEGVDYIASAYCEGPDLDWWLRQQTSPVAPRRAAAIIACLADALHYSHQRGVLHRDLKPANVLLDPHAISSPSTAGEELPFTPRLTDFGLARLLDGSGGTTAPSAMLGTPNYMSPEQTDPKLGPIGPATDVHGLGVLLYELLAGRPPFQADAFADVVCQVRDATPVLLSRLRRDLPRDLETICFQCLEKRPGNRYSTAQELGDDLRRFLRGEPLKARPPGRLTVAWKWCQRKPLAAVLAALAVLLPVAGVGALLIHNRQLEALATSLSDSLLESREWERQADARSRRLAQLAYASTVRLADDAFQLGDIRQCRGHLDSARQQEANGVAVGLEWSVLDARIRAVHRNLGDPLPAFTAVAYAPQGNLLAAGGEEGQVQLLAMPSGTVSRVLPTPHIEVRALVFDPASTRLAATGEDGTVTIWNVSDGRLLRASTWRLPEIPKMAWIEGGQRLAVAGDKTVRVWDVEGDALTELATNPAKEICLMASPDGRRFACGTMDSAVRIWNAADLSKSSRIAVINPWQKVNALAFDRTGTLLAVGYSDEQVVVYRFVADQVEEVVKLQCFDDIRSLAFSPAGDQLAILQKHGILGIWDLPRGKGVGPVPGTLLRGWQAHEERGMQVAWAPDGREVVTVGYGSDRPRAWSPESTYETRRLTKSARNYNDLRFTPDSQFLVVDGKGLERWSLADFQVEPVVSGNDTSYQFVAISPESRWVATIDFPQTALELWPLTGGTGRPEWKLPLQSATQLLFSKRGDWLAVVDWTRDQIRVVDREQGTMVRTLPLKLCYSAVVSPTDEVLVSHELDDLVVFDTDDWSITRRLKGHVSTIRTMAMSVDGRLLASAGDDREIRVWQTSDWSSLGSTLRHSHPLVRLGFTPDGTSLLALDTLGEITIWQISAGLKTSRLWSLSDGPARQFSLSPDGQWLAVIVEDGQVLVRRLGSD